jgi:hypothetical protein
MSTSVSVFERVAAREITPERGAELLMSERDSMPKKPGWMPRWMYVAGVVTVAVLFAPLMNNRDRS